MVYLIKLSASTQTLIKQVKHSAPTQLSVSDILALLQESPLPSHEATYEALRAAILCDLYHTLLPLKAVVPTKRNSKWHKKLSLIGLTIAGILYAICNGFDGVASILSLFTGIPAWAVFVAGFVFSILSIMIFCGLELKQISQQLDVDLRQAPSLLDYLLEQTNYIKLIRRRLKKTLSEKPNALPTELREWQAILNILQERHTALDVSRQSYAQAAQSRTLASFKIAFASIIGVLFFSYGFFSGQTLAIALFGLFNVSLAIAAWPTLLISTLIGAASLSVYWFAGRDEIENLVATWCGLDRDKIKQFTHTSRVQKEGDKLAQLAQKLDKRATLSAEHAQTALTNTMQSSHNIYFFSRRRAVSDSDIPQRIHQQEEDSRVYFAR